MIVTTFKHVYKGKKLIRTSASMHQFVSRLSSHDSHSSIVASFQTPKICSAFHCSGVFSVPFRVVSNGRDLNTVFSAGCYQAVARYEMPVVCLVSAGLACNDNVFAVVFDSFPAEAAC